MKEAAYKTETQALLKDKLQNNKTLCRLSLFMDQKSILRVEGRIKHALLVYDEKHPIILPKRSTLIRLIMTSYHSETLHGGMQQTKILGAFWTDVDKKSHTSMSSVYDEGGNATTGLSGRSSTSRDSIKTVYIYWSELRRTCDTADFSWSRT